MGGRIWAHLPVLSHQRGGGAAPLWTAESGQHPSGAAIWELIDIKKQGCGKPNRIYPKSYEAVPNTDFKKSRSGTPES